MTTWIDISETALPAEQVHEFLYASQGGGVCVFVGTTRRVTLEEVTEHLWYEAHNTMALKEMEKIAKRASQQWSLLRVVMLHRTGKVSVGEASVIVGAATAHRGPAFEATRFLIDELKKSVQIWKKDVSPDGSSFWVDSGLG